MANDAKVAIADRETGDRETLGVRAAEHPTAGKATVAMVIDEPDQSGF